MSWVLYGATGYTGELLAAEAVKRGHRPLLAGRSAEKLEALAQRLGLEWKAVDLSDARGLRDLVAGRGAVLHAAGPFVRTSKPMADACLDAGVSYLDITGELPVFQALFARDEEARRRGVALLPGVGFDVVPSDCFLLWLARRVERPRALELAIAALGQPSGGTARSVVGIVGLGGLVRRGGRLVPWPLGRGARRVRFSSREAWAVPAPLADLETAFRSTGVPDITVCLAMPSRPAKALAAAWPLTAAATPLLRRVLGSRRVRERLEAFVGARAHGPDAAHRETGRSYLWGAAEGEGGRRVEGWLETCEGYQLTAQTGVRCVERVLKEKPVGALTPAQAFGPDFILEFEGTRRLDALS